jgi:hypothetical protein
MPIDTRSRTIDTGADSIRAGITHISWMREILAANLIDHHARDRVDAVVAAAALRMSARDDARASERRTGARPLTHGETEAQPRARVTLVGRPQRRRAWY